MLKKFKDAIKSFKKALLCNSSNAETHFNIANCYFIIKEYKLAKYHYEECLVHNLNQSLGDVYLSIVKCIIELKDDTESDHANVLLNRLSNNVTNEIAEENADSSNLIVRQIQRYKSSRFNMDNILKDRETIMDEIKKIKRGP